MSATPIRPHGTPAPDYAGPKRSLILPGGGMRLSYQAGAVRALLEEGLCFFHADGTSGGSINLAMLLSGLSPEEMCARWRGLDGRAFVSFLPLVEYVDAAHLPAMGDADNIRRKVFPGLGIDFDKIRAVEGMEGTFNVGEFTRKVSEVIPHREIDEDYLVAGMSLPIFLPAVAKNGKRYLDAAWIRDANLMEAVRRGAEELWVIWGLGNSDEYRDGAFYQYVHMLELSAHGMLFEEFERIEEINRRIAGGEPVYGHTRPIRLHLIKPEYPLPLDPDLYFGRIDHGALVDMGYRDAKAYLKSMRPEGLPLIPEITKMKNQPLGIRFRETMAGGFALGETDPRAGKKRGEAAGTELAMHATVTIRDIERFTADPEHAGELIGNIDFPPFGTGIPAKSGRFNLFSPTDDPAMKYMVYELGFERAGKSYYLAGHKEVKDDPGFDLWSDTTTLYTTLHEGEDADGPVVGAGVLSLGVGDLMKLAAGMTVLNAEGVKDSAETLARFGRFFMGELWDSYVKKISHNN